MSSLLPKYIGILRRKTNAQLLAWQGFNFLKFFSLLFLGIGIQKLHADIDGVKLFEQLLLIGSAASFFFISGLGQNALPFFEGEEIENKESFFKSLSFLFLILGALSSLGIYTYGVQQQLPHEELVVFSLITLITIPSYAMESYFLAYNQQFKLFGWGVISYALQVPFLLVPLLNGGEIVDGLYGLLAIASFKLLFCLKAIGLPYHRNILQQSLRFLKKTAPIVLAFIVGGSYVYFNAFIVEEKLDANEFLMYRYGAKEFPLFLIIANSFSLVFSAKIALYHKRNKLEDGLQKYKKKTVKVMHQLFPAALLLLLISDWLFTQMYNEFPEVAEGASFVFCTTLFILCSRVLFPQTILYGLQKNKLFLLASSFELVVGLFLSFILIEDYGLLGVSIAMVAGFMTEKIVLILACYFHGIHFFKYFPSILYLLYSGALTSLYYWKYFL